MIHVIRRSFIAIVAVPLLAAGCASAGPTASPAGPTASAAASATVGPAPTPSPTGVATPAPTATVGPGSTLEPSPSPTQAPASSGSPSPQPTIALSAAGAPALPTRVRVDTTAEACDLGTGEACATWQASWLEADPAGVTIRVYGVTACLHEPTPSSSGVVKCLANGDTIPSKSLVLLAAAPATDPSTTFHLATGEGSALGWLPGGGPTVYALVVQAVNVAGGSHFVFAAVSGSVWGTTL